ncbi:MAG TPA: tyrosine-protein phosphatase [Solirubrobacteraceae bacterium]|nr:tyrosine-protein phosphatase [Solirubrobacteraceae bacterium]
MSERQLDWDGCFNVRDLGGLPTTDGQVTRWGSVVRADALDGLTAAGWAALCEHGVRTVIDLRNEHERGHDAVPRPAGVRTCHVPLDGTQDREFWSVWESGPQFGTPLYYRPHLDRFPSAAPPSSPRSPAPSRAESPSIAAAGETARGAMLVLALVGVAPEGIAADYVLSSERLRARYAARGEADQGPLLESFLADRGTTAGELIIATLAGLDVEAHLRDAGLTDQDLAALRRRLVNGVQAESVE